WCRLGASVAHLRFGPFSLLIICVIFSGRSLKAGRCAGPLPVLFYHAEAFLPILLLSLLQHQAQRASCFCVALEPALACFQVDPLVPHHPVGHVGRCLELTDCLVSELLLVDLPSLSQRGSDPLLWFSESFRKNHPDLS